MVAIPLRKQRLWRTGRHPPLTWRYFRSRTRRGVNAIAQLWRKQVTLAVRPYYAIKPVLLPG